MKIKFSSSLDAQIFIVESRVKSSLMKLNKVNKSYVPTTEEMKGFIKSRGSIVSKIKDYRKSANSKANWRKNRTSMMKGIKAFHKSVEGKRFHKKLGNFIASRILRSKTNDTKKKRNEMLINKKDYLIALNSVKQHLLIELDFFHQVQEQIEIEEFITCYAYPYFKIIEDKMMSDTDLTNDELVFLIDLVENNSLIKSFADKTNQTFAQIEKMWNSIESDLKKNGIKEKDSNFFPFLISRLKKGLGIKE